MYLSRARLPKKAVLIWASYRTPEDASRELPPKMDNFDSLDSEMFRTKVSKRIRNEKKKEKDQAKKLKLLAFRDPASERTFRGLNHLYWTPSAPLRKAAMEVVRRNDRKLSRLFFCCAKNGNWIHRWRDVIIVLDLEQEEGKVLNDLRSWNSPLPGPPPFPF